MLYNYKLSIGIFLDKYLLLIGGENDPTRVDVVPVDGAPACSGSPPQFTQATTGSGLSGGVVDGVPIICGEAGVDFACQKLASGASQWTTVGSGIRFFEATSRVFNNGTEMLTIGGR